MKTKKLVRKFGIMLCAILILSFVVPILPVNVIAVSAAAKIKMNKSKVTLYAGGKSVKLKISGTSRTVTWKSSNSAIAKVTKKGNVYGLKKGKATITGTVGGKSYKCVVTVNAAKVKSPVVVFEDENAKISYVRTEKNNSYGGNTSVVFRVENKTNRTLTFQADVISLNGESTDSISMSDDVAPQSNGFINARCDFDLDYLDISDIKTVSGELSIIDFNDRNFHDGRQSYSAKFVSVNTDGTGQTTSNKDKGDSSKFPAVVFEDENAKISYVRTEKNKSYGGNVNVIFRVENKTDRTLTFQADAISLNGESTDSITMSDAVAPKSNGFINARCDFDLNYLNINKIKTVGGELSVIDFNDRNFYDGSQSYSAKFVSVNTDGTGQTISNKDNGDSSEFPAVVFEDENAKISYVRTEKNKSYGGNVSVIFRVENKTNRTLTFQADAISLNGESTDSITMSDDVAPKSNGFINARCDFDLAYLDISEIKTIGGELSVIDFNDRNFRNGRQSYSVRFINIKTDGSSNITPNSTTTLDPSTKPSPVSQVTLPDISNLSETSLEKYLNSKYGKIKTDFGEFDNTFDVLYNPTIINPFDYKININSMA